MENAVAEVIGGEVSYGDGLVSYLAMENSFNVIATASIFSDFSMIVAGFCIVFFYTSFMLGRFHLIENRVGLEFLVLGILMLIIIKFCCRFPMAWPMLVEYTGCGLSFVFFKF